MGKLAKMGTVLPPGQAWDLAYLAFDEVHDIQFWCRSDGGPVPVHIRAHLFLAFKWLSPLMLHFQRQRLVDDLLSKYFDAVFEGNVRRNAQKFVAETASFRYMLDWLRDEVAYLGSTSDAVHDRLVEMSECLAEVLPKGESDSPDRRNLARLQVILEMLGVSPEPQANPRGLGATGAKP
jgi:hypothetical protein